MTSPPAPLSSRTPFLRERGNSAAGYNLVMLMVLLTILNIVLAASLPAWSSVIRREKEEELIFRGLQYAEAIRVFRNRFSREPIRLEELIEVEPRTIRQLWKDPMTENGKWVLIPAQGPTAPVQVQPPREGDGDEEPDEGDEGDEGGEDGRDDDGGFGPRKGDEVQVGPFKGVHSRSGKTSIMVWNGKERYDEWHFTVDLFLGGPPAAGPGGDPSAPAPSAMANISARWIGRPLPEFLMPRQGTGLPEDGESGLDGQDGRPGGRGGSPGRPGGTGKP